jgi:hypothetical protein
MKAMNSSRSEVHVVSFPGSLSSWGLNCVMVCLLTKKDFSKGKNK